MDEAYVERVLRLVEQVPAGRVTTYGDIAEVVGWAGPRQVGRVLATYGGAVCWWRVLRADGQPARGHEDRARILLRDEGVRFRGDRVELIATRWEFGDDAAPPAEISGITPDQSPVTEL